MDCVELNQNIFIFLALLIFHAASLDEVATGGDLLALPLLHASNLGGFQSGSHLHNILLLLLFTLKILNTTGFVCLFTTAYSYNFIFGNHAGTT